MYQRRQKDESINFNMIPNNYVLKGGTGVKKGVEYSSNLTVFPVITGVSVGVTTRY